MRFRSAVTAAVLVTAALGLVTAPAAAEQAGTIGGRVWFDRDGDGVAGANEPGRAFAVVTVSKDGAVLTTTRADEDGRYTFAGLVPADYQVTSGAGEGYLATTPATVDLWLDAARQVDFGVRGARLDGTVWADQNGDGVRQETEAALPIPQQLQLEGKGFGTSRRPVDESGRFTFDDLPGLDGYVLHAPDRSGDGVTFTAQGHDSVIAPASGGSAPFALAAGEVRTLGVGYRPARADLALAALPVLNAAARRPVDVVAKVTNHGATATGFHVRVTTPADVRVTKLTRLTRLGGTQPPRTVTGVSTAPLAPGATAEVRFTLVGDHSLTGEVTVTVGAGESGLAGDTRTTTLNVTAARHVAATAGPKPQGAVAHRPFDADVRTAPAEAPPARSDPSPVITTVLAAVLIAASAALVVVLRRRVSGR